MKKILIISYNSLHKSFWNQFVSKDTVELTVIKSHELDLVRNKNFDTTIIDTYFNSSLEEVKVLHQIIKSFIPKESLGMKYLISPVEFKSKYIGVRTSRLDKGVIDMIANLNNYNLTA